MTSPQTAPAEPNERTANPHGDFIWYELMTDNTRAAQTFYAAVLGWTFQDSGQSDMDYAMFSAQGEGVGGFMALTSEMSANGAKPCWMAYIKVDDVDAAAKALTQAGGTVHRAPWDIPGVGRIAFVADPQGVMFYIMKPKPPAEHANAVSTAFAYDAPMVGHCAWNELATTDQSAAVDFYTQLFGWRQEGDMDMGPTEKYQFLYHGEKMLGAVMNKPEEMPVPMWTYYFRVASIEKAMATIKTHNGQVLNGPHEIPGGDSMVNCLDPQGAMFSLVGALT